MSKLKPCHDGTIFTVGFVSSIAVRSLFHIVIIWGEGGGEEEVTVALTGKLLIWKKEIVEKEKVEKEKVE